MLLIIVVLITALALAKILRVPRDMDDAHLGWMSQQWLAEHRAAHPS
jgi:hypothetical protein